MKTKTVDKKGRKRSLSETSFLAKSDQKQENAVKLKKNHKKAKLAISVQNGNPKEEMQIIKVADKQKKKQNKKAKQNSIVESPKIETMTDAKKETKLISAKPKKKALSLCETKIEKIETLKYLQRRQKRRESRKQKRQQDRPYSNLASIKLNVEEIKKKIQEIRNREVLSKRAKKILVLLKKKLEEMANKSEKLDTIEKKSNAKSKYQAGAFVKNNANNEDKMKEKKKHIQNKKSKIKPEDQDDNNVVEDNDDEDESDENQSDAKEEESIDEEQIDNESNEDEEDKDDEDEEDEVDADRQASTLKVNKEVKNKKKQAAQSSDNQKKEQAKKKCSFNVQRYVLFVGNLPHDITAGEIKQHFLTQVHTVNSVRIPTKSGTSRGFAYVEMTNRTDFERGLLLNHTFLKKKRIKVEYSMSNDSKKAHVTKSYIVAKNKKLQALQKTGKLASGNQGKKKLKKGK